MEGGSQGPPVISVHPQHCVFHHCRAERRSLCLGRPQHTMQKARAPFGHQHARDQGLVGVQGQRHHGLARLKQTRMRVMVLTMMVIMMVTMMVTMVMIMMKVVMMKVVMMMMMVVALPTA